MVRYVGAWRRTASGKSGADASARHMRSYVLIGGASSRMGSVKADLLVGGRTFLDRVIAAASEAFDEVVVVQRSGEPARGGSRTIHERAHEGTASIFGLERAMEDAGDARFWLLALDYPLITGALLSDLRARWEVSDESLIVPIWNERPQLLCAGWSGSLLPRIRQKISAGEYRLRDILDESGATIAEADLRRAHRGEPLLNVNEPAELERARRIDEETESSRR